MKAALLGLSQSGKSTLISAISGKAMPPAGSVNIEEAIVPVPDTRVDWLTEVYKPKKTTYATIDCLDLPGFNFSDEHGHAAAKRLINKIRNVDLLVFVVRAFQEPNVPHYKGSINPERDLVELKTELLLADLELVTTRIENLESQLRKPTKTIARDKAELILQKKLQETIEAEKPLSSAIENEEELSMVKSLGFLTLKPVVVAVNISEEQMNEKFDLAALLDTSAVVIQIVVKLAYELSLLDRQSRAEFMAELGVTSSAADKFVKACFSALGMISFLTHVSNEVRAWPIKKSTTALDAAGKIHTDIKRGFIRAETIAFDDLKQLGDEKAVKAAGKIRLEGKDYIVQDGDIINFRFNV